MIVRVLAVVSLLWAWLVGPAAGQVAAAQAVPAFDHIFVIVMENHSYAEIIGDTTDAPYINQLAASYGVATNYTGVAHPSLPNYLALVGGDTFGITSDCTTCFVNAPNLAADRIAPSGRTWKAYMEDMPSGCSVGDAYPYAQKHNPFVYFDDVRTTGQCSNVVPLSGLATDLSATSSTPAFAWITPNLCNDMHDCSIAAGDSWLSKTVPEILNSPAYTTQNTLLLITWDEDDSSQNNQIPTLVVSPAVSTGFRSTTPYDHYSLLRTIEQAWGLSPLTAHDSAATPMADFFAASPPTASRIDAGGPAYTGADGRAWQADSGFNGGTSASVGASVAGTADSTLYRTERYGKTFGYALPLPNGNYTVVLKFAEIYWTSAGQRVFNVAINGQPVLTNFDILANVPRFTALDKTFSTSVASGTLSISFTTVADNAKIGAIEVLSSTATPPPPPPTAIRVDAGGPAYTGGDGRVWQADSAFNGGTSASVPGSIAGTPDSTLYRTERYGKTFSYTFAVPNGVYSVTLKFAEIYWTSAGQRVFSVAINGQPVLTSFDILANVPRFTAIDKSFSTSVTNGTLAVAFTTVADNAKIGAIEVLASH